MSNPFLCPGQSDDVTIPKVSCYRQKEMLFTRMGEATAGNKAPVCKIKKEGRGLSSTCTNSKPGWVLHMSAYGERMQTGRVPARS